MKRITIVGIGMSAATTTQEGLAAIRQAEVLLGARRVLNAFSDLNQPTYPVFTPDEVKRCIQESAATEFAVLVSGDTGFYSAADGLCAALSAYEVRMIPGISSLNYLFATLKRPWQDAALISCHGRDSNLIDTVRRNFLTFVLTGGNALALARQLVIAGFGSLSAIVGENLGMEGERIVTASVAELAKETIGPLAVLLIENPAFDKRARCGIPDEEFIRGEIPMTKAEVRAIALSKLGLSPDAICWDIGCGTGSVTVELALAAYRGHVYAVDRSPAAVDLTRRNCAAFQVGNVKVVSGPAPDVFASLPPPDGAFIGGSGGNMRDIISCLLAKNPRARIVVSAIAWESLTEAMEAFAANSLEVEIIQVGIARAKATAGLHMLLANNPVFLLSGGGG